MLTKKDIMARQRKHKLSDENGLIDQPFEDQISYMRDWFYSQFEDPAQNTPYESAEGGYQYIWGGPYYAIDVLMDNYEDIASKEAIEKLVSELNNESSIWTGRPDREDYSKYYYDNISVNTAYHGNLINNLDSIHKLIEVNILPNEKELLNKILFVNVITSLESFLAEAFIQTVVENEQLLRVFIETNPDFAERNISLNEIFNRVDGIKIEVRDYLLDFVWHNLAKVKKMYEDTFGTKIITDLGNIFRSIAKRHDIVHRNGRTKDGNSIIISENALIALMQDVRCLANDIDNILGV